MKTVKPTKEFFVRDHYKNEIYLFGVEVNGIEFFYHHLENFFELKLSQVESEITKLFETNTSTYPCLAFFKESIDAYFASNEIKQKSIHLMGLSHIDAFRANQSTYKTYKIKINQGLSDKALTELKKFSGKFILDANQSLSVSEYQKLFDLLLTHDLMDKIIYFEEPVTSKDLLSLSKDLLAKIALDETLFNHQENIVEKTLDAISWLVIKPSMITLDQREIYYRSDKNITLSSCYEHPSLYHGFFKEAFKVKNNVHGLSTFEIHPDTHNNYFKLSADAISPKIN